MLDHRFRAKTKYTRTFLPVDAQNCTIRINHEILV